MKKKTGLLLTLALTGGIALTGIQVFSGKEKVKAETTTEVRNSGLTSFTMLTGARIKIASDGYNHSGLRFEGEISKADYDSVVASNGTFGMIIVPSRLLGGNLDNFTSEYYTDTSSYIHLDFGTSLEEDNGKYRLIGAITAIHLSNLDEEFIASAYVRYVDETSVVYEKAGFSGTFADHSRSCRIVAEKLIERGDENATWLNRYYLDRVQVNNYGFEEDDFTGWTIKDSGLSIENLISSEKTYFNGENELVQYKHLGTNYLEILQDGLRFLTTDDAFVGTVVSPSFTLGGDGWISFKLGAGKAESVSVNIVDEEGNVIQTVRNDCFADPYAAHTLFRKWVKLDETHIGKTLHLELVDEASADFGFLTFDSLIVSLTDGEVDELKRLDKATVHDKYDDAVINGSTSDIRFLAEYRIGKYDESYADHDANLSRYEIVNGDFERGDLYGWTKIGGAIGAVTSESHYWLNDEESSEGYSFGKDGDYLFSCYAEGQSEGDTGALISSDFVVGGSGFMTYKIGAAKNISLVHIEVIEKESGKVLKVFGNEAWADRTDSKKSGCSLIAYKADLRDLMGKTVYLRIVDNAVNDYGLLFLDAFRTYYPEEPSSSLFRAATPVDLDLEDIYSVQNGGFETGDLSGWSLIGGEFGKVSDLTGYWGSNIAFDKDGNYLFHGLEGQSAETDPSLEGNTGSIRSNVFLLKKDGWISFKLGAAKNASTGLRIASAETGEVIASFHNTEFGKNGNEGKLIQYAYQISELESDTYCYIEIFDDASSDWGLVSVDSVVTNYAEEPALDYVLAVNDRGA